ncbi:MAG: DUF2500 domain-containing protein [Propionicimonas sp.]|nr:DUF2500 domain-containing protein [Propionicimonas sp.]
MNASVLVLLAIAAAIVILAALPALLAGLRVARRRATDNSRPRLQAEARVVDKRTHLTGSGATAEQRYYATFQFPDGGRVELAIPAASSGLLVVGDEGHLDWQGTRYHGFAREILR